jgi:hypothetical protein
MKAGAEAQLRSFLTVLHEGPDRFMAENNAGTFEQRRSGRFGKEKNL